MYCTMNYYITASTEIPVQLYVRKKRERRVKLEPSAEHSGNQEKWTYGGLEP